MNPASWQTQKKWIRFLTVFICLADLSVYADEISDKRLEQGRQLVMARGKGNCIACHVIDDGELPGNLGPPLMSMRLRFPNAEVLREQIWDSTERNPNSRMPPFGKNGILSEEEIEIVVEYLYSL